MVDVRVSFWLAFCPSERFDCLIQIARQNKNIRLNEKSSGQADDRVPTFLPPKIHAKLGRARLRCLIRCEQLLDKLARLFKRDA